MAREFKKSSIDENNFSPTSSFASVRMLLVLALIYDLAVTALDVKDAFLMAPQIKILYVKIPQWIRRVPIHTGFSNVAFPGKETQHCVGISTLDNFVNKQNLKHFQEHQQSFVIGMSTERCL